MVTKRAHTNNVCAERKQHDDTTRTTFKCTIYTSYTLIMMCRTRAKSYTSRPVYLVLIYILLAVVNILHTVCSIPTEYRASDHIVQHRNKILIIVMMLYSQHAAAVVDV